MVPVLLLKRLLESCIRDFQASRRRGAVQGATPCEPLTPRAAERASRAAEEAARRAAERAAEQQRCWEGLRRDFRNLARAPVVLFLELFVDAHAFLFVPLPCCQTSESSCS